MDILARRVANSYIFALLLLATSVLIVVDTTTQSYFEIMFVGDVALGPSLLICFCVIVFFAGIAFLERDFFILTVFAAVIIFFVFFFLYFMMSARLPINFNSLGSYYGALTFIVFYTLAKHGLVRQTMRIIFYVCVIYLAIYSALSLLYIPEIFAKTVSQKVPVVLWDVERGARLVIHLPAAGYVAMYSFSRLLEKFRLTYLITLALAIFAAYLSFSRFYMVCGLTVLVLYLLTRRMRYVQLFCFCAFLIVCGYFMWGFFDPAFNPYGFSSSDTSTLARYRQYDTLMEYIRRYPILGIGIPDSSPGLTYFLGRPAYPSDVGIIGVWFQYGIIGAVFAAVLPVYICCLHRPTAAFLGSVDARSLALTGCVTGLSASSSAELFVSAGLVLGLISGCALYNYWFLSPKKQKPRRSIIGGRLNRLST